MTKLYSYNNGSASAKALANALGIKILKHQGRDVHHNVINWGASIVERPIAGKIYNFPACVADAVNKLTSFCRFEVAGVVAPEFTEDAEVALEWLREGFTVVERNKLNGHSGEGIRLVTMQEGYTDLDNNCPLFVKYIKKQDEYRLHVFQGEVFFVQRKARKLDVPDAEVNWQVRNHQNGFIYANQNIEVPELFKQEAVKSVACLGLDFGAVDLITEKKTGNPYILEINCAPGMSPESTTLARYVDQFRKLL